MPVRSSVVGTTTAPHRAQCDARWLMAYSAGLGLADSVYLDTTRPGGVAAHPLFPVAVEWGLLTDPRCAIDYGLSASEARRGVHASHDLILHRPLRSGDDVAVTASVVGVEATRAGARVTLRFDGVDVARGDEPVWTTWYVSIYRGITVEGADIPPQDLPAPITKHAAPETPIDRRVVLVPATAAHVYTECARIWNPIHTDLAVAEAAGLPATILHGTATLAHGVTSTLDMIGAAPDSVRRLAGSFRAMVVMPTALSVELLDDDGTTESITRFHVRDETGVIALQAGIVETLR